MAIDPLKAELNIVQNLVVPDFEDDVDVIQKLDDEPNDVGGLTAAELKAKFDEGPNKIKDYINNTLVPSVSDTVAEAEERAKAEQERVSNENYRREAEENRVAAENARVQAEENRVAAENTRDNAEQNRIQAEASREEAERVREEYFDGIKDSGAVPCTEKGAPNGVAALDEEGKVPNEQLHDVTAERMESYVKSNVLPDSLCNSLGIDTETAEPKDAFDAVISIPPAGNAYVTDLYLYITGNHPILNASPDCDYPRLQAQKIVGALSAGDIAAMVRRAKSNLSRTISLDGNAQTITVYDGG